MVKSVIGKSRVLVKVPTVMSVSIVVSTNSNTVITPRVLRIGVPSTGVVIVIPLTSICLFGAVPETTRV